MMENEELSDYEKMESAMNWFENEIPDDHEKALIALVEFYIMEEVKEQSSNGKSESIEKSFDWSVDAPYILAEFLQRYRIDLTEIKYLHWHKFKALFDAIVGFSLAERISYRTVDANKINDKSERKRIRSIKSKLTLKGKMDASEIGGQF